MARMDYLPHLDSVSVTKIGLFGCLYNQIHRVDDLEKQDFDADYQRFENMFRINPEFEPTFSYKHRKTGELFYFERNGVWNWQGVSHPNLDLNK